MRGRGVLVVVLLCAALVTTAERSHAGSNRWTTNGPFGGSTTAIAAHPTDPSIVLAGTAGGIFHSSDGGSTWTFSSAGVPSDSGINDLEFAASNPAIVFAGTYRSGLFKSTDGGHSWTHVDRNFESTNLETVAIDPTNPRVVYTSTGFQTFKSVDGGATWVELDPGFRHPTIAAADLVIAPSAHDTIYAAGGDWWRSKDGGATWNGPLQSPPFIQAAVVHPTNPDVVVAAAQDGLHRSTDGGFTWTRTHDEPGPGMTSLAIDPTDPNRMYAGAYSTSAYSSIDGGTSWTADRSGLPYTETWLVRSGLSSYASMVDVRVLADGSAVAGVAYFGFFKKAKDGAAWSPANEGLVGTNVQALATPPSGGPNVYAGVAGLGVARSQDNGASWQWVGLRDRYIETLAVHPTNPSIVYAATNAGVYKSTNAGSSWRLVHRVGKEVDRSVAGHTAVAIAPSRPSVVYAATSERGVFRSDDSGGKWRKLSLDQYSVVSSLAVHPQKPYTVYAGTRYFSVARSTDGGKTWRGRDDFLYGADRRQIAIDPTQPSRLYAALDGGGVYRSTDSGKTWRRMGVGTLPHVGGSVVVDRSRSNVVYAGFYGDDGESPKPGVFKSTDRGETWTRLNEGLTTTWVESLALSRSGRVLHAGTFGFWYGGGGVFSRTFG
jgi:photosystem II stability/assembly factor-like uncharacterized protein